MSSLHISDSEAFELALSGRSSTSSADKAVEVVEGLHSLLQATSSVPPVGPVSRFVPQTPSELPAKQDPAPADSSEVPGILPNGNKPGLPPTLFRGQTTHSAPTAKPDDGKPAEVMPPGRAATPVTQRSDSEATTDQISQITPPIVPTNPTGVIVHPNQNGSRLPSNSKPAVEKLSGAHPPESNDKRTFGEKVDKPQKLPTLPTGAATNNKRSAAVVHEAARTTAAMETGPSPRKNSPSTKLKSAQQTPAPGHAATSKAMSKPVAPDADAQFFQRNVAPNHEILKTQPGLPKLVPPSVTPPAKAATDLPPGSATSVSPKTTPTQQQTKPKQTKLLIVFLLGFFLLAATVVAAWFFATQSPTNAPASSNSAPLTTDEQPGSLQINYVPPPSLLVPGRVQAEDYNTKGSGISFADSDNINSGGTYRNEGVDIVEIPQQPDQFAISDTKAQEWVEYTITVAESGRFAVSMQVAATIDSPGGLEVLVNNKRLGTFYGVVPETAYDFSTHQLGMIDLAAGEHVIRLRWVGNAGVSVDWIEIAKVKQ